MNLPYAIRKPTNSTKRVHYRKLSLIKLVKEIVEKSNRYALEEFHNHRTLFRLKDGPPLLFTDYLKKLRESTARRTWIAPKAFEVADKAYDLTLDKFNNVPNQAKNKHFAYVNLSRVDCRYYFKAFLEHVTRSFKTEPPTNGIEEEARAATIMQGLVRRHFYLSRLEAERNANPFWSRYYWEVRGRTICVWLPVSLEGRERKAWLEKNMPKPNPRRPEERERIQAIIDRKLPRERLVTFREATDTLSEERSSTWPDSDKTFEKSLAEAVAEEKATNIQRQRRSIRVLGEERLKQLILRIFKDLSGGQYEDKEVAGHFGLKKATFSRFAGSRWLQGRSIPDLWRNTAEVLSTHPTFKEVAINTGVWEKVKTTLERAPVQCKEETNHDQ